MLLDYDNKGLVFNPDTAVYFKPKRSGTQGNCFEVAEIPGGVAVRDSRNRAAGVQLYTTEELRAFVLSAKDGDYDHLI